MEEFVRSGLASCLKTVDSRLRKLTEAPEDFEKIHRLRIAIRKTLATLHTFAQFWDRDEATDLERRLHRLGRLCGKARDCDVALGLLKEAGVEDGKAVARVKEKRKRRRRKIARTLGDWRGRRILKSWRKHPPLLVGQDGPWRAAMTATENAQRALPVQYRALIRAGGAVIRVRPGFKELHKFRLAAKEFRYTLERFERVWDPALRKMHGDMERLQTRLGAVIDCVAAGELVEDFREEEAKLEDLAQMRLRELIQFWKRDFSPAGPRKP